MTQIFKIDMGGVNSPFQVFDSSGNLLFDATWPSLRAYGLFTGSVGVNSFPNPLPSTNSEGTNGYVVVSFGKTFSVVPLLVPLVKFGISSFQLPAVNWPTSGGAHINGGFVTSFTDSFLVGNYSPTVAMSYAVL